MKLKALVKRYVFVIVNSLIVTACSQSMDCSVRKIKFDQGWKFHLGQIKDAAKESCDDSEWRVLNLPHDWSAEPLPDSEGGIENHLLLTVKMLTSFIPFILREFMRSPKCG